MTSNINNSDQLYKITAEIPVIPNKSSKESAKNLLAEFAFENNFVLAYHKTDLPRLEFKCTKGGTYRNTRGTTDENRKRQTITKKTNCPYKIRYKVSAEGVYVLQSQTDIEMHHNHPLTVKNLCTLSQGRMSKLTPEDVKTVQDGIRNKLPAKVIQRSISNGKSYNSLYSHDIANMKAKQAQKEALPFRNSDGKVLIENMKSHGYNVFYRRSSEDYLSGIVFATDNMLARAKRFNEVYIIDATYDTNNLRMPLISVYGVSNIGERLMTFAVAFAWVSNETEITYKWFLEILNQQLDIPATTVFVTDKCQQLISQINTQFPNNHQLLCTWHIVLINYKGADIHAEYSNKIADFLDDREKFASEDARNSFKKYFDDQWLRCEKKWKAVYTCELAHFGSTTTQRAESGHAALETEMSEHQSLSLAFSRIATFMDSFKRNYQTRLTYEQNTVVIGVFSEISLHNVVRKVSHKALKQLKQELAVRDELDNSLSLTDDCRCEARLNYNIPCRHDLVNISPEETIELSDIPYRWHLFEKPEEMEVLEERPVGHISPKHFMKYVNALEAAFERCEGDSDKTQAIQDGLLDLLGLDKNLEPVPQDRTKLNLPFPSQVKFPGRPKKQIPRKSALKKDHAKKGFRRTYNDLDETSVVNATPMRKIEPVPVPASGVLETKIEKKRKAEKPCDEELSLPLKARKPNESWSIPRRRKVEDIESIASRARSAATASLSSHRVHQSIRREDLKEIHSPRADGFCGFRAAAHALMDESSYPIVKRKMLEALDKYKGRYMAELGILEADLEIARTMISCGVDRPVEDVKKADKRSRELNDDSKEQLESVAALKKLALQDKSVDEHRRAVVATFDFWFQDFDCGQILADAFAAPVCIYPSNDNEKPFTFLPLDLPKDQRVKPRPIHLQYSPLHWISLRFSATHSGLLGIYYDTHWNKKQNMLMFVSYWNRRGQFPKCVKGRIEAFFNHLIPVVADSQIASAITLESDDEEIIDLC